MNLLIDKVYLASLLLRFEAMNAGTTILRLVKEPCGDGRECIVKHNHLFLVEEAKHRKRK
jgi:hypothetical protein